ncbi:MAG: carboxy-S-adenosyl-L-methionine synthase CmoA [Gammaproteobacteria bacterium]|nr:carboxy-S-adenosyl-L-methionine synthase CmoA [Gammaproteobacteria bacterium]
MKDDLFSDPLPKVSPFQFDKRVADVFPDMIQRSVPGYSTVVEMTGLLAAKFAQGDLVYELGCSRGACVYAMGRHLNADSKIIGLDNSEAMLSRLRSDVTRWNLAVPIELTLADMTDYDYQSSGFISLNWTLQFIAIEKRASLLKKLYASLKPGCALVVSEKLFNEDPLQQALQTELHHDFKRSQGYTELEIAQKRDAIENVLIPETEEAHIERFHQAGFNSVEIWFRCFNFASFIALK